MIIPKSIQQTISDQLNCSVKNFSPLAGGCINTGGKLSTSVGNFFLKWNKVDLYPTMLKAEADGLAILQETNSVRVPTGVKVFEIAMWQFILMEFVESSPPSKPYWEELGRLMAKLHKSTTVFFGLDHDNYIGSLPQKNKWTKTWTDFFIEHRLEPQLKILRDANQADSTFLKRAESLYPKLSELMPEEVPALLHGDLWSGNVLADKASLPCVFDPAIYYGHREAEIAFTHLFGGFDNSFYESYNDHFPLESGFEERIQLYNLYPLLVHANIFGQNYMSNANSILLKYV